MTIDVRHPSPARWSSMQVSAARFEMAGKSYLVHQRRTTSPRPSARGSNMRRSCRTRRSASRSRATAASSTSTRAGSACSAGAPGQLVGEPLAALWPEVTDDAGLRADDAASPDSERHAFEIEREMHRGDGSTFWCRLLGQNVDATHPVARRHAVDRRGHHRAPPDRPGARRGARPGRSGEPRQERLPRQHQPRDPHAAERPAGPGAPGACARLSTRRCATSTSRRSSRARKAWPTSSPTCSTCRRSRPASSSSTPSRSICASWCRRCTATYLALAQAKGLLLTLAIADDVPDWVLGDRVRTRQILVNFLTNAIKFTDVGRRADDAGRGDARPRAPVGHRQRAGHGRGDAAAAVPPLLAGRRVDHAALRRHRPRAVDLPRARAADGRRGRRAKHARRGSRFWVELPLPPARARRASSRKPMASTWPACTAHAC